MPIYAYRCSSCGNEFEIRQSFTEDALTVCDTCGGELRKLFGNIGVVFKGSGFYSTDNKSSTTSAKKSDTSAAKKETSTEATSSSSTSSSSSGDGSAGSTSTPAAAPAS